MHSESGHKILESTIQLAHQHLAESAQHNRQLESQEQAVEGQSFSGIPAEQPIKKHTQAIQQHLVAAKDLANELEQTKPTEVYTRMNSEHTQAVQEHIEATKEFLKRATSDETSETPEKSD